MTYYAAVGGCKHSASSVDADIVCEATQVLTQGVGVYAEVSVDVSMASRGRHCGQLLGNR